MAGLQALFVNKPEHLPISEPTIIGLRISYFGMKLQKTYQNFTGHKLHISIISHLPIYLKAALSKNNTIEKWDDLFSRETSTYTSHLFPCLLFPYPVHI